jgi:tyrocidine synthetase-3
MWNDRNFSGKVGLAASQYGKEGEYWLEKFSDNLTRSSFPYDYPRSKSEQQREDFIKFEFNPACVSRLMEISKGLEHRLYMILTAALVALLHKYTGNNDIIIGSPIFKQEAEGNFINTVLALRNRVDCNITFKELLMQRVRQTIVEANEHQNYPIETLLFQLNMSFTGNDFPLFDVVILLENIHEKKYIQHVHPNIIFSFLRTDETVEGRVEYNSSMFERSTVQRILRHFISLAEKAIFNVDIPLFEIDILGEEEKRQLLVDFNNTSTEYPADRTIDWLFEEQVARKPEATAVTYEGEPLSYRELNEKADRLAYYLHAVGVGAEAPIALMAENSHKVIVAILGILKAGGAYVPLNIHYPEERKKYILGDCHAKVLLTNDKKACDYVDILIDLEDENIYTSTGAFDRNSSSNTLAYIMYTSGSTGTPKGVMVEHRSVVRLVKNTNYIEFNDGDSILLTGALEFDASTFEIWGALLNGLPLHLVSKDTILSHDLLKEAVRSTGVSTMWMTSPLFNQMLDEDIEIFKGLKKLLVGGDVLSLAHINRLRQRFPELMVINGYGPTENTTFSTTHRIDRDYEENIPIGHPISNSTAYIFDAWHYPVPIGIPGELFVGGDGVARGYLNNPELTAEKFLIDFNRSHRPNRSYISRKLYRTGDLALWLPDGTVEFLGRADHQVKIRGYRIEPVEIENYLKRIESINEAVVMCRKNRDGEKYLCAYIVGEKAAKPGTPKTLDVGELKKKLSIHLPDYMVPAYFLQLEELPLNTNGKVDWKALPEPEFIDSGAAYVAPRNMVEEKFVEIWSAVLGVDKGDIGIDSDFFELGGHSLKATIAISKFHKAFNVKIPLAELFRTPTIRELAEFIKQMTTDMFLSLKKAEKKEYYELSSAQKRLYVLHQVEPDSISYNVPQVVGLEGSLDIKKMERVFRQLIERHESFRTSFKMINEEPVQLIHDSVDFEIEYGKVPRTSQFIRPFDLSQAPLLRVGLITREKNKYILMVDIHHIITDGTSMDLLVREFMVLYAGEELPVLRFQYKDYAEWQNSKAHKEAIKAQEEYWLKQFEGDIPVLNLPINYSRPAVQSFEGSTLSFELSVQQTHELNVLALKEGATLYMVLVALTNVFLSRICNQEDIVVGTAIAARRHVDLETIIGMFVNTLALRNYPGGEKTFRDFLQEVKGRTLEVFENQEYQFENLVEQVTVNRDASRNPLFDVVLALPNMEAQADYIPIVEIPQLKVTPCENEIRISKFDINITFVERGKILLCTLEYCTKLFRKETIERFAMCLKNVLSSILKDPGKRIAEVEMVPEEEKKRILYEFNDTKTSYPRDKTIHQLFEEQVERAGDRIAVTGQSVEWRAPSGLSGTLEKCSAICSMRYTLTYRELNEKSNQLAHILMGKGVKPDVIVAIMTERSIQMVVGILGILKAGGAYLPIDLDDPKERIHYMLSDSSAKILVSGVSEVNKMSGVSEVIDLRQLTDSTPHHTFPTYRLTDSPTQLSSGNLAYIIYTSGSTGRPKGVLTTHYNVTRVVHNTNYIELTEDDRILQLSNYAFDGSVFDIYGALLNGAALVLLSEEKAAALDRVEELIKKEQITVFFVTTALFNLMVDEAPEIFEHIRKVLFGGERVSVDHTRRALTYTGKDKVIHVYGPTETTVYATYYYVDTIAENVYTIPIGSPLSNTTVYILDRHLKLLPIGVVGELYIGGYGTGRGYLNRPELTAEKFDQDFQDDQDENEKKLLNGTGIDSLTSLPLYPSTSLYRTGDLARWMPEGNIEFMGRIDNQVKIRGFRIEPEEIEAHLLKHGSIKEAVVIVRQGSGGGELGESKEDKFICAYITPGRELTTREIREYLSKHLPDYMIPAYFVFLEKLPLTSNGKVDRKALPVPEFHVDHGHVAPRNDIERKLADIWAEVLGIEKAVIGIDSNFFELGGHSLKATVLIAKTHKHLKVKLPLAEVFQTPTIRGLSGYINGLVEENFTSIEPVEKKEYYVLSSAQKRLYILHQMDWSSTAYNIPEIIPLPEKPDIMKLEETFKKLIDRHESLRTSFHMVGDQPVQKVHEKVEFAIRLSVAEASSAKTAADIIHDFVCPFDLAQAPLLRVGLMSMETGEYLMMIDMHHIISDGISHGILMRTFLALQRDEELAPLRIQYKDFSRWQNSDREKVNMKQQETYWLNRFAGEIPVLNLPTDYAREAVQSVAGSDVNFEIEKQQLKVLQTLSLQEGVTLFMLLLAVYNILLSRISGQEDIVVGSPIAGRRHEDLQKIMGMFVNTLALRNYPRGEKSFVEFLKDVKESTLGAFENQEYQFEDLVEKVAVNRDVARNPLFDVMFTFQNLDDSANAKADGEPDKYGYANTNSKFDMTLTAGGKGEDFFFLITYNTTLFMQETIEKFAVYFKNIISSVTRDPELPLSRIEIIPAVEKRLILESFNGTECEYPEDKTIQRLFENQAARTPDNIAVINRCTGDDPGEQSRKQEQHLTYRQLNEKSSQLGALLRNKGIGPGSTAVIMVDPSLEMMVGIMAVLKTGACYVPIDLANPRGRIDFILDDSEAQLLLTQTHLLDKMVFDGETLNLEDDNLYNVQAPVPEETGNPSSAAYMIYTSGTTGQPKGVMVTHRNLVNYVTWFSRETGLTSEDKTLLTSSFAFDLGYTSIYPLLLAGGQLHLLPREFYVLPEHLLDYIRLQGISYLKMTPSLFAAIAGDANFSKEGFEHLRLVVLGGEAINVTDVETVHRLCGHIRFMNHYGPTEVTIGCIAQWINFRNLEAYKRRPTIGKPVSNTKAFILDKYLNLSPVGIPGELCLSGAGVAKGYFKKEDLTSEKFIANPFMEREEYERIYRTGDLARWLPDGSIEFLERIDHQVKIRGYRIELGEIESRLLAHKEIKEAVVLTRISEAGSKYLCAYIVPSTPGMTSSLDPLELKKYLSYYLPDYMIPSHLFHLGKFPLTANGKLDRKALPDPTVNTPDSDIVPRDHIEKAVAKIWSEVLKIKEEKIGINTNFFEVGGHSLGAIIVISRIHKVLKVKIPLVEIFKTPFVKGIATYIKESARESFAPVEIAEKKEYYTLSPAQKRVYILQQRDMESTVYNMPQFLQLERETNLEKLRATFEELIRQHESLRTSFQLVNGQPVQRIQADAAFDIEYHDLPESEAEVKGRNAMKTIVRDFVRPFDLADAPLLRVGVIKSEEGNYILMTDIHHIVCDGVSRRVLMDDCMTFYQSGHLQQLSIHYKDYSEWLRNPKETQALKPQEAYWLKEFDGQIPVLNLPIDYNRPKQKTFEGDHYNFEIESRLTAVLKEFALQEDATLFMLLLTVTTIFLSKLSGQSDIVVGTPVAGRTHAELEKVIGMFVNTLPMRNFPRSEKTCSQFFREVKERTLQAFQNQDYPFDYLVENVANIPDKSRNPLFDVMLSLQNIIGQPGEEPDEHPTDPEQIVEYENNTSKFDLSIDVTVGKRLFITFEYCTKLFQRETIQLFAHYFEEILCSVVDKKDIQLKEIGMIRDFKNVESVVSLEELTDIEF